MGTNIQEKAKQALKTALTVVEEDSLFRDIKCALRALAENNRHSLIYARRALSAGFLQISDQLDEKSIKLCTHVIDSIVDKGGPLPEFHEKLSHIHLRIESRRKSAYVKAAQKKKKSLSGWMIDVCDREANLKLE